MDDCAWSPIQFAAALGRGRAVESLSGRRGKGVGGDEGGIRLLDWRSCVSMRRLRSSGRRIEHEIR